MQTHLNRADTINLGSFYTPQRIVVLAYEMLEKIPALESFTFLDSSCGYGDFFTKDLDYIGADIDKTALQKLRKNARLIHTNSLENVSRAKFGISPLQKLIIIGNPPYNDKTSIIRAGVKKELFTVDKNLRHRDLGVSFLRSYASLKPDFICVLHPLSYLIKRANFKSLQDLTSAYRLRESIIISSEVFTPKSSTFFPIIVALYEKNALGMDYDFIKNYEFKTLEGAKFRLNDFDFIANYVQKYPNFKDERKEVAYFYTLRDINALKRSRTFMDKPSSNSVKIFAENLKYYYYIHHFKHFAAKLPYYFGNLDVFINNAEFLKMADVFMSLEQKPQISSYFKRLFKDFT